MKIGTRLYLYSIPLLLDVNVGQRWFAIRLSLKPTSAPWYARRMLSRGVTKVNAADVLTIPSRASHPKRVATKPRLITVPGAFSRRGLGPCVAPCANLYESAATKRRTLHSRQEHVQTIRRSSLTLQNLSLENPGRAYDRQRPKWDNPPSPEFRNHANIDGRTVNTRNNSDAHRTVQNSGGATTGRSPNRRSEKGRQQMYLGGRHVRKRLEEVVGSIKKAMALQVKHESSLSAMKEELRAVSEKCVKKDTEQRALLKLIRRISDRLLTGPGTKEEDALGSVTGGMEKLDGDDEFLFANASPPTVPFVVPSEPLFAPPPLPTKEEKLLNKYRSSIYIGELSGN